MLVLTQQKNEIEIEEKKKGSCREESSYFRVCPSRKLIKSAECCSVCEGKWERMRKRAREEGIGSTG